MGYTAIVTVNLHEADASQHELFYQSLKRINWEKIDQLENTWKSYFIDRVVLENATVIIINELKMAKQVSQAKAVHFAIGFSPVEVGYI